LELVLKRWCFLCWRAGASEHLPPQEILAKLELLEAEIASGMKALEALLSQEAQPSTNCC
jgi:hypothetical protein